MESIIGGKIIEFVILHAAGSLNPLDPHKLQCGAACLLDAGYRAPVGYLSEAKKGHVRHGWSWTDALQLELKDCIRACLRGLGPPKRAPEVRASLAARMEDRRYLSGDKGPRRARRGWVVAVW